jgi:hypothetical protein
MSPDARVRPAIMAFGITPYDARASATDLPTWTSHARYGL